MIKDTFEAIRKRFSGTAAKNDVAAIIQHHRIQASPGYREAAGLVLSELRAAGVPAEIERYPADFGASYWTAGGFQEWEAQSGTLRLLEPADKARTLADFREEKIALIQRSLPFKGTVEVVLLEDGLEESEYEGLDLAGKMVMTKANIEPVRRLAVEKHGAVGIIFDGMRSVPPVREAVDLPDTLQYTSFWWTGRPGEVRCFGFVLSPRQGAWLRDLIQRQAKDGKPPVKVEVDIQSTMQDGEFEVVVGRIPGTGDGQVVGVAHLCHPQPSANDNASGAAALLETARTLQSLIAEGTLPQPQRSILFLWVPEMLGTYAYLSRHEREIPAMVAGVNLDMVGSDLGQSGAAFIIERPPEATSSFVPTLVERLREELFDDAASHTGLGAFPLFRYATTGFSGGSDHVIFADPTVNVPMPMLITMPDRFYHTSADTLDKIDPAMLARTGSLAAAFLYLVAAAGQAETTWLAYEMHARFQAELTKRLQAAVTELWDGRHAAGLRALERRADYWLERQRAALATLTELWNGASDLAAKLGQEAKRFTRGQLALAEEAISASAQLAPRAQGPQEAEPKPAPGTGEYERKAAAFIPVRRYRGPADIRARLSAEEMGAWFKFVVSRGWSIFSLKALAEYWADGQRTMLEIVDLVELESGLRDAEFIVRLFEMLARLDLVDLKPVLEERD